MTNFIEPLMLYWQDRAVTARARLNELAHSKYFLERLLLYLWLISSHFLQKSFQKIIRVVMRRELCMVIGAI